VSSTRISVVIPAYDAAGTIVAAIDSLRAQTFDDWEAIVVDDGSADGTAELAAAAGDTRVRVVTIPHSGRPAVPRNEGIRLAHGTEIAFLDADDVWFPTKLERQLAALDRDPVAGLVHCAAVRSDGVDRPSAEATFERLARAENPIYTSSVVLRTAVLDRFGSFDVDPRLRGTEDFDLWLRLVGRVRFIFIDEPLLRYSVRPGSLGSDATAIAAAGLVALDKAIGREPDRFAALGSPYLTWVGSQRFRSGVGDGGRRELRAAVARDPFNLRAVGWLLLATLRLPRLRMLLRVRSSARGRATRRG